MTVASLLVTVLLPALIACAALSDLASMTIPNRLCLALALLFAPAAVALGLPLQTVAGHLAAGALVLTVCFGLFAAGWIGGGDAKLATALAIWMGFPQLMPFLLVASVAGGALTLIVLLLRQVPLPAAAENRAWIRRLHAADKGIPYGVALAAAGIFILPGTLAWKAALGG